MNNFNELIEFLEKMAGDEIEKKSSDEKKLSKDNVRKLVQIIKVVKAASKALPGNEKEQLQYMAEGIITESTSIHLEIDADSHKVIIVDNIRRNVLGIFHFTKVHNVLIMNHYKCF